MRWGDAPSFILLFNFQQDISLFPFSIASGKMQWCKSWDAPNELQRGVGWGPRARLLGNGRGGLPPYLIGPPKAGGSRVQPVPLNI